MKKAIDITLTAIHDGRCHRVVTLGIDGKDPAFSFLEKLRKDDCQKRDAIDARIRAVSEHETYENKLTFRHVGDGVYEFKRSGVRLYAFRDTIEEHDHLIICTNGGKKNTKKQQNADIARAQKTKRTYQSLKRKPDVTLTLEK